MQLFQSVALILTVSSAAALPQLFNETTICAGGACEPHDMPYERMAPTQPGYQWDDAGGYCGSWATQRALLAVGAWVSQQQVRDHTSPCGGHDNEILSCNYNEALDNLKVDYEEFDYKTTPLPQTEAYAKWLKKQLVSGSVVVWMILWSGQEYPIYNLKPPAGMYGHVEPVVGIASNHPLNDTTVYDDDEVLHFTDAGTKTVHRTFSSLPGKWAGPGHRADCGFHSYCISNPYGFGWAVKGYASDSKVNTSVPASLSVDPWKSEPDTRSGEQPIKLAGTLTATGLTSGRQYDVYRWDSVSDAMTYDDKFKVTSFTATADSYQYADATSIASDGTTYYRVVEVQQLLTR